MTGFEYVMSALTAIYVAATVTYVRISKSTLHAIRNQAEDNTLQFSQQIAELKKSADAASRSADAAKSSVASLDRQFLELEKSANAAKASADALINSERAWLLVEIGRLPMFDPDPTKLEILWIHPTFKNCGRTIAHIKTIRAVVRLVPEGQSLPQTPEYPLGQGADIKGVNLMLPPNIPVQPIQLGISGDEFSQILRTEIFLYIHGFVEYLDLTRTERRTAFCFYYAVQRGYSPAPSAFYLELTAPPEYNDCT